MKTISFIIAFLVAASTTIFAQCDKTVTLTTSKTDHLDSNGNLTRCVDETARVVITKSTVDIKISSPTDDHEMAGTIKSFTCNWTIPYKDGKTVITASLNTGNGENKNVTITITGKGGKITLLFEAEDEPDDHIRVIADKFEASA